MVIRNLTRGTVLADHAWVATGTLQRMVGLLNRSLLNAGEAMVFPSCWSIHTCFMRFSIDVLFVEQGHIRRVVPRVRPFQVVWSGQADMVIELPEGTVARTHTQAGDRIEVSSGLFQVPS